VRYVALAAGFDGTLSRNGRCDERVLAVLRALAASGRKLILVTSRELRDLLDVFPEARLFDYLVAENGAVVHRPSSRESAILAQAPSEVLIHELRRRDVKPLSVGSVVVTTSNSHREVLTNVIQKLQLDSYVLDNGDTVAVLPVGVNKVTGVQQALEELGLSSHNLVAIGDAENDIALFEFAEHGVAVANATSAVKRVADRVTRAASAEGVAELANELLTTDLSGAPTRRRIVLGNRGGANEVTLPTAHCSVLLSGPASSGKAALCNSVLSQYLSQHYQCCVIGAYSSRGLMDRDGVLVCGDELNAPRHAEVLAALEQPVQSVIVNLAALRVPARAGFAEHLLERLASMQSRNGRPHAIVLDQAEGLLTDAAAISCNKLRGAMRIYVTAQPQSLPQEVRESIEVVVALGDSVATLSSVSKRESTNYQEMDVGGLEVGQALLWIRHSGTAPFKVELDLRPAIFSLIPEPQGAVATLSRVRAARENNEAAVP
jgi:hydroxymethylpyrimidine pyrophosphatase-like HAD family hydrolase